ncbi:MAG: glycosyl hydrolase [Bacteroidia bacterium]|nr:glycosyl hydrolase [Bacteroidia bacterium]
MRFRILLYTLLLSFGTFAQSISWTGVFDNVSLFNAGNWKEDATGNVLTTPLYSTQPINQNVTFGAASTIGVTQAVLGTFNAGTGTILFKKATVQLDYASVSEFSSTTSITIDSSIILTGKVTAPSIVVKGKSELHLYEEAPIPANAVVNMVGDEAWVFFHQLTPVQVTERYVKQFKVNGFAAIASSNIRVVEYYGGTVVIPQVASFKAMYLYSGTNLTGTSKYFRVSYNVGPTIGVNSTSTGASFILKRGYMACIGESENGSGSSKIYIAEDSDLIINGSLNGKNNTLKMIRVTPWRWLTKKGVGGGSHGENFYDNWFYNWGSGGVESVSYPNREFVPMQWGKWGVIEKIDALKTQPDVTHLLGFNEPDHTDQSNMTVAECLANWPKLQEAGLRLGAPSLLDKTLLYEFMDSVLARGYRVDYFSLHNYGKITGTNYINNVVKPLYDKYKIPVWVTEYSYGANWNTDTGDNALTYYNGTKDYTEKMDASPMVERYAIFTFKSVDVPTDAYFQLYESYLNVLAPKGIAYREFDALPSRGAPLMYRTKISKAKKLVESAIPNTDPIVGVFQFNVTPLSGPAPHTISYSGAKLTTQNKAAFYKWSIIVNNDTTVSTFFNGEYTFTQPGEYVVKVTAKDLATQSLASEYKITVTAPSATIELKHSAFHVSPNPVLTDIRITGVEMGRTLKIYDIQGNLRIEKRYSGNPMDVSALKAGLYMIRCEGLPAVKMMKL